MARTSDRGETSRRGPEEVFQSFENKVYSPGYPPNQVRRSEGSATRNGLGSNLAGQRMGELANEVRTNFLRSAPQRFAGPMMILASSAMTTAKPTIRNPTSVSPEI